MTVDAVGFLLNRERVEWINRRERQLLVHSFLYYQMDSNVIADSTFDLWSKEVYDVMQNEPELFLMSTYCKEFAEFDGSSGAYLPYSLPHVQQAGQKLLRYHLKLNK